MCCLESKINGDYPKTYIDMFRVKMYVSDSPRSNQSVLEEDPDIGQTSCPRQQVLFCEGTSPRRGLGPPKAKIFGVVESTVKSSFLKIIREQLRNADLFPDDNSEHLC